MRVCRDQLWMVWQKPGKEESQQRCMLTILPGKMETAYTFIPWYLVKEGCGKAGETEGCR